MRGRVAAAATGAAFLLGLSLTPGLAAAGGTVTIDITAAGPRPASAVAAVGDTVVFRNVDPTFVHAVASKSANWSFSSGPLTPGQRFSPGRLPRPGEYDYQGANLDRFSGKIVIPAQTPPAPPPAPPGSAAAPPSSSGTTASGTASPAAAAPGSRAPAGGSGPGGPPLAGGVGVLPGAAAPAGPSPLVASAKAGSLARPIPAAGSRPAVVAVGQGRLPEPPTGRRYGLPAALAVVGAVGVASLLVRLLLTSSPDRAPRGAAPRW